MGGFGQSAIGPIPSRHHPKLAGRQSRLMHGRARRFAYPVSVESLAARSLLQVVHGSRPILSEGRGCLSSHAELDGCCSFSGVRRDWSSARWWRPPPPSAWCSWRCSSCCRWTLATASRARPARASTSAERAFAELDQRRQQETLIKLTALAENRALGDALARLSSGRRQARSHRARDGSSRRTVRCRRPGPDRRGRPYPWPARARDAPRCRRISPCTGRPAPRRRAGPRSSSPRPSALFRASGVSLTAVNPAIGFVYVVTALDDTLRASSSRRWYARP